jgi:hypothetical protein
MKRGPRRNAEAAAGVDGPEEVAAGMVAGAAVTEAAVVVAAAVAAGVVVIAAQIAVTEAIAGKWSSLKSRAFFLLQRH